MTKKTKTFFYVFSFFIISIIGLLFSAKILDLYKKISPDIIKSYILSFGKFSIIGFILIFAARTLLIIFPCWVMLVVAGNIFGTVQGIIYSTIAIFLSATIAFFIGRFSGNKFVHRLLNGRIEKLDINMENNGGKIVFIMRVVFIFPFDALSYVLGMTNMKYTPFIFGSVLGFMPECIGFVLLGKNLSHPFSYEFLVSIISIVIVIFVPFLYKKRKGHVNTTIQQQDS